MKILMVLIAGILGGLVNSLGVWIFGVIGLNQTLGFKMAPALTVSWLMPRLISSGLWGLLFLLPFWSESLIKKGIVLSTAPLAIMLFIVFPKLEAGMLGFELGYTAPLFAVFFTMVWGVTAASFLNMLKNYQARPNK